MSKISSLVDVAFDKLQPFATVDSLRTKFASFMYSYFNFVNVIRKPPQTQPIF